MSTTLKVDLPVDLSEKELQVLACHVASIAAAYKERSVKIEESTDKVRLIADFDPARSQELKNAYSLLVSRTC